MPVNVREITHERLGIWEKLIINAHATPTLLLGIGHDHVKGQLVVCVTEDCSNEEVLMLLYGAIKELQKQM
jgi:hypothetical protein